MIGILIVFVSVVAVGIPICCLEVGYRAGVRETERRWSEAVKRAEYARAKEGEPR